ncbi:MAG: hypothetical protein OHK0029_00230 [Armatimonadaceae bacterium]
MFSEGLKSLATFPRLSRRLMRKGIRYNDAERIRRMNQPVPPKEAFHHCPRCTAEGNTAPAGASWFDCGSCGFRFHFNAAVSVSSVIVREDGLIFLIRRARDPAKGKLAFPGGFVDPFETAEEALTRETSEEVGMTIDRIEYLGSFVNPYPYRGIIYPVLDLFYTVRVTGTNAELARDEVTEAFWLDPTTVDLNDIAFPSMQSALLLYRDRLRQ